MKVLIVRLSSFGDVVHTFPALSDLARARPEIEVDWLVDSSFAAFAGLHPAVNEVLSFPERATRWPPSRWPARWKARGGLRRKLRERRYDLVVDLQGLLKSAALARLAAAPIAGYDGKSIREPLASRFYSRRYPVARDLHAVERNRRLLAAALDYAPGDGTGAFGLKDVVDPAAAQASGPSCLFVHSASWPSKLWPEENWRRLAGHLSGRGLRVLLPWGSEAERARAERIAAGIPMCEVLPERLDGGALAGVVGRMQFAVGLDSGLMHLATALDVPGVWLFGPTDPGLTGPYGRDQTVVRSTAPAAPCRSRDCAHAGQRCMEMIDLASVMAAVDPLVARGSR